MAEETTLLQPTIFGNLIIDTYTIILLGFRIPGTVSKPSIIANLQQAAVKLTTTFPFLAGQVIVSDKSPTSTGTYRTVPYAPHSDGSSIIRVKDCESLCPSYDELAKAHAPMSMLDGNVLSPKRGFYYQYDMITTENPVLIIQANFIKAGVLLTFASQHNVLDMNANGQMIRLFACACRGENFAPEHVEAGNRDSAEFLEFLREGEKGLAHPEMRVPSSLGVPKPVPTEEPVPSPWNVFRISGAKAKELKAEASKAVADGWVSTNDAVTALFWQRLVIARRKRFPDVDQCTISRAVNGRRALDIPSPEGFMGHCVFVATTTISAEELMNVSLSRLALELRRSIPKVNGHYIRSIATAIRDEPDRTTFNYGAALKTGLDMLSSSFAGLGLLHCSFGPLLGKAEFARRPRLDPAEGLSYIMPVTVDGDIDLVVCLRVDDIEALQNDRVWREYVDLIG